MRFELGFKLCIRVQLMSGRWKINPELWCRAAECSGSHGAESECGEQTDGQILG